MNEVNNKNKKQKNMFLLGLVTLLFLVVGATYAYFAVTTVNNFGTSTINATAGGIGSVTLTNPTSNIHLSVSALDMASSNEGKLFYATNEVGVDRVETTDNSDMYITSLLANTYTIAKLELQNDTSDTDYKCTFDLNFTTTGDMPSVYAPSASGMDGKVYLYNETDFNDVLPTVMTTGDTLPLYNTILYGGIPTTGTYPMTIYLNGQDRSEVDIGIAMYVENSNYNQNHLAGTTASISMTASNLTCTAVDLNESRPGAPGTILANKTNVSSELLGGLYRYTGNANNNYICFGTSNLNTCTSTPDQYMYRILGVTSNNKLKLIKNSGLDSTIAWDSNYTSNVTWPNTGVYTALNGSAFLANTNYVPDNTWANKIDTTTWKYGDTRSVGYSGDIMYTIENSWQTTASAKIGLMYTHDYIYGMDWLNAYAVDNSVYEWMITRVGIYYRDANPRFYDSYRAFIVYSDGRLGNSIIGRPCNVRPVFYLISGITLTGEGTSVSPYLIG